jgi:predicted nucleic acid-binding protein
MILVDAGPLVALFDPRDWLHDRCVEALQAGS